MWFVSLFHAKISDVDNRVISIQKERQVDYRFIFMQKAKRFEL